MGATSRVRRRLLLFGGSGVVGIAILDALAGCQSSSGSSAGAAGSSSAGPSPAASGSGGSSPAASSAGSSVPAASGGGALQWHQVAMPIVSAYLLQRGSEVAIVDCGLPGSQGAIDAGLKAVGSGWDAVKHVVLTHRHPDHVGGLPAVEALVKATLYAGAKDVAAITSARPLKPLRDGDDVFGLRILDTPGHTVGHVSVFDPTTGVLVAGDALRTTNGLQGSDPKFTASASDAVASVKKLGTLDVKVVLPGHGVPLTSGASAALRALAASL